MEVEISVISPIYNEEKNISPLYIRVKKVISDISTSHELLFVNDGSADNSLQLIRELAKTDSSVKFINFSRNFGHQIAVTAGLDKCLGKHIVIIDSDLQDHPEFCAIELLVSFARPQFLYTEHRR